MGREVGWKRDMGWGVRRVWGREMGWGWRCVEEKDQFVEGDGLREGVGLTRGMSLGEICIWGGSWAGGG